MSRKQSSESTGEAVGSGIVGLGIVYLICLFLWGATVANIVVGLLILLVIFFIVLDKSARKNTLYTFTDSSTDTTYHLTGKPGENAIPIPEDLSNPGACYDMVYALVNKFLPGLVVQCSEVACALRLPIGMVYEAIEKAPRDVPVYRIITDDRRPLESYPYGGQRGQREMLLREGVRFSNRGQVFEDHIAVISSRIQ